MSISDLLLLVNSDMNKTLDVKLNDDLSSQANLVLLQRPYMLS